MFLFCLVFAMFCSRLFICALWPPAGKGLTSWLSFVVSHCEVVTIVSIPDLCTLTYFVMFNCAFVTFPCGILGQVWYLIVSIPDLCRLSYFYTSE